MEERDKTALEAYSRGAMTALEARRHLGGATYGELLQWLGEEGLPLPRAPEAGREEQIARAPMDVPAPCPAPLRSSWSIPDCTVPT